jgi:hypothetical protein
MMRKTAKCILTWAAGAALCFAATRLAAAEVAANDKLPSAQAIRSAQSVVKEVFQADYKRADAQGRAEILEKMRAQANDPKNEPAVQYVILLEVAAAAASAGAADMTIWVSDELASRYPAASVEGRFKILTDAVRSAKAADAKQGLGDALLGLADDAGWAGDFSTALRAAEQAKPLVLAPYAVEKIQVLREIVAASDAVKREGKNAVAYGAFLCFGTGEWESGLPILARGNDRVLAAMAAKDLSLASDAGQLELADSYMEIATAKARSALVRSGTAARAAWWYGKALPGLGGTSKIAVERKLAEARRLAVWTTRSMAVETLRTALLSSKWSWPGPDVQMSFREDGTVSHRGMHGIWKIASPRVVFLTVEKGESIRLHFDAKLTHYSALCRGISGDRIGS